MHLASFVGQERFYLRKWGMKSEEVPARSRDEARQNSFQEREHYMQCSWLTESAPCSEVRG